MRVIVYLPVADERALEAEGHDPADWVREAVKRALSEREVPFGRDPGPGASPVARPSRSESEQHFKPDPKPTRAEKKGRR